MERFSHYVFFCLLVSPVGVFAIGQPSMVTTDESFQLFKSYRTHAKKNNYSGIFIIDSPEGSTPFKVHHFANKTLVSSIEGVAYDIQMTDQLRAIYTKSRAVEVPPLQYDALLWSSMTLNEANKAFFRFERKKTHRVCDRQAEVIDVLPVSSEKYGLRLYIDPVTGLILKKDILNTQGELIESYTFVMLDVGHTTESMTHSELSKNEVHEHTANASPTTKSPVSIEFMPQGFSQTDAEHDAGDWVFTIGDGLFHASIFLSLVGGEQACPQRENIFGSFSAFCRALTLDKKYYQVMVTGNLPLQTIQKIAENIH